MDEHSLFHVKQNGAVSCAMVFHVKRRSGAAPRFLFHVKRAPAHFDRMSVFHVKHSQQMNEEMLLTYTEFAKDLVEDIFNVHSPQQPPE